MPHYNKITKKKAFVQIRIIIVNTRYMGYD